MFIFFKLYMILVILMIFTTTLYNLHNQYNNVDFGNHLSITCLNITLLIRNIDAVTVNLWIKKEERCCRLT